MSETDASDLTIREPTVAEIDRVLYLFVDTPLSPATRLLAMTGRRPLERFIAAAAWWPQAKIGHFQFACRQGISTPDVAPMLLESVSTAARNAGMESIQFATVLTETHEWFGILRKHGFECSHSERSFEVSYRDAWTRVMQLHQKHHSRIPLNWRTEPIRNYSPETIFEITAPHRLLPPAELMHYWQTDSQSGFDPELSCILFDGARPFGTFLLRRLRDGVCIDIQVVQQTNPRLRSLGDLMMLHHVAQRVPSDGPIRWIWFRSGHTEHRQTANLALRMGGRELVRCHTLTKPL